MDNLIRELKLLKNEDRALQHKNYHKSNREHWGVTVPDCAAIVKAYTKGKTEKELLELAEALWKTDQFDNMVAAIKVLSLPRVKPSKELWKLILNCLKVVDGWALEDGLAHPAWKCILADESLLDTLEKWTDHPNFWMRRAALIYTLPYAKKGRNPERMLTWAAKYADDPEWFIQKAIGWWLRVLGEHNPERVMQFLEENWPRLKGVARKEATRKLSPAYQARAKEL